MTPRKFDLTILPFGLDDYILPFLIFLLIFAFVATFMIRKKPLGKQKFFHKFCWIYSPLTAYLILSGYATFKLKTVFPLTSFLLFFFALFVAGVSQLFASYQANFNREIEEIHNVKRKRQEHPNTKAPRFSKHW